MVQTIKSIPLRKHGCEEAFQLIKISLLAVSNMIIRCQIHFEINLSGKLWKQDIKWICWFHKQRI